VDLKPQEPAVGVVATSKYPGFETYRIVCSCGNPDDDIEMVVENDDHEVIVSTYTTQKTSWWEDPFKQHKSYSIEPEWLYQVNYYVRGFLNALWHRLKITWSVWIHGHVKYNHTAIMTPQQALNYSETLSQAVKNVQRYQATEHQQRSS